MIPLITEKGPQGPFLLSAAHRHHANDVIRATFWPMPWIENSFIPNQFNALKIAFQVYPIIAPKFDHDHVYHRR
ncbi:MULTISPECIES: hypothetical protein [Aeromonas]|uniref:hypothetical protein n=1 Tax=Aeromonas TaxID=642 RepID=UPI002A762DCE|nr:hypothetical protein [Aeromonas jandaei]